MARRPVFLPKIEGNEFVEEKILYFDWYPGFSPDQVQKSIKSLHREALRQGFRPVLEISSSSPQPFGVQLSAFNLQLRAHGQIFTVEAAYQGSKVFERGGPFTDIYVLTGRDAKKDPRLVNHGRLLGFNFFGMKWNLHPPTAFYDWLYLNALAQNPNLSEQIQGFAAFSDIHFNPEKSFSCQARSAALYVSLMRRGKLEYALSSQENFLAVLENRSQRSHESSIPEQQKMF